MAVYKVPQDVEADDKLIGPFSFKQFVFILITVGSLYVAYLLWRTNPALSILPLPFAVFFGILGFWPRRKQPIEVYLTALIHFWTKPRKRIWNQEGHVEHVHINVPKKVDHKYTDGLSRHEVRSNLKDLAQTLDSRGWSAKNVEVRDVAYTPRTIDTSDRLAMPTAGLGPSTQPVDVHERDDILDTTYNSVAQNFDQLSQNTAQHARDIAIQQMQQATQQATEPPTDNTQPQPDEYQDTTTMETDPSPAILNLANNSDLSVSTLAKEAEQVIPNDTTIELH